MVYDGEQESETLLARAEETARGSGAELTLLQVVPDVPPQMRSVLAPSNIEQYRESVCTECSDELAGLAESIRKRGVQARQKVAWGTDFLEIIKEVLREGHDLVMLSPRRAAKWRGALFGTRTMHLMRKCPCPVWAVKRTQDRSFSRVLAAVDPVPNDEERNTLNRQVLDLAASVAQSTGGEMHVAHAWSQSMERIMRNRAELWSSDVDRIVDETREAQRKLLEELMRDLPVSDPQMHLLKGEPEEVISEVAENLDVELVVMGTVSRSGLAGFLIGNTAERILQSLDCSVLAVKPQGFVSPVTLQD